MKKNKNDQRSQQPGSKSNEQSTEKNKVSLPDKLSGNVEDTQDAEEKKVETTFQRRPQFRLSENNRRRFF
jgi:hypothetical protein